MVQVEATGHKFAVLVSPGRRPGWAIFGTVIALVALLMTLLSMSHFVEAKGELAWAKDR
jgi:hypothetical protein